MKIKPGTMLIKVKHDTKRVPLGTILTFRSLRPHPDPFNGFYSFELGSYSCSLDNFEVLG